MEGAHSSTGAGGFEAAGRSLKGFTRDVVVGLIVLVVEGVGVLDRASGVEQALRPLMILAFLGGAAFMFIWAWSLLRDEQAPRSAIALAPVVVVVSVSFVVWFILSPATDERSRHNQLFVLVGLVVLVRTLGAISNPSLAIAQACESLVRLRAGRDWQAALGDRSARAKLARLLSFLMTSFSLAAAVFVCVGVVEYEEPGRLTEAIHGAEHRDDEASPGVLDAGPPNAVQPPAAQGDSTPVVYDLDFLAGSERVESDLACRPSDLLPAEIVALVRDEIAAMTTDDRLCIESLIARDTFVAVQLNSPLTNDERVIFITDMSMAAVDERTAPVLLAHVIRANELWVSPQVRTGRGLVGVTSVDGVFRLYGRLQFAHAPVVMDGATTCAVVRAAAAHRAVPTNVDSDPAGELEIKLENESSYGSDRIRVRPEVEPCSQLTAQEVNSFIQTLEAIGLSIADRLAAGD